jgi:predicted component of type VI protein secretion system
MKLNYLNQLLGYADNVTLLEENIKTIQNNAEILQHVSKAIGLGANVEKIK